MGAVKFVQNGREVSLNQFMSGIEKSIISQIKKNVEKIASSTKCPTHGEYASVEVDISNLSSLKLNVKGCCDELVQEIKKRFK